MAGALMQSRLRKAPIVVIFPVVSGSVISSSEVRMSYPSWICANSLNTSELGFKPTTLGGKPNNNSFVR